MASLCLRYLGDIWMHQTDTTKILMRVSCNRPKEHRGFCHYTNNGMVVLPWQDSTLSSDERYPFTEDDVT